MSLGISLGGCACRGIVPPPPTDNPNDPNYNPWPGVPPNSFMWYQALDAMLGRVLQTGIPGLIVAAYDVPPPVLDNCALEGDFTSEVKFEYQGEEYVLDRFPGRLGEYAFRTGLDFTTNFLRAQIRVYLPQRFQANLATAASLFQWKMWGIANNGNLFPLLDSRGSTFNPDGDGKLWVSDANGYAEWRIATPLGMQSPGQAGSVMIEKGVILIDTNLVLAGFSGSPTIFHGFRIDFDPVACGGLPSGATLRVKITNPPTQVT